MKENKQDKLKQAGWRVGDAEEFLGVNKQAELLDRVRDLIHDLAHDTGLSDDDIRILDGLDKIEEELNHE